MSTDLLDYDLTVGPKGTAIFSKDGKYRYRLTRPCGFGKGPTVVWIMMNPSKANAFTDDLTVTKCIGFCARPPIKAKELIVVNLFAYISTDPAELCRTPDPVGRDNDAFIRAALLSADRAIAAWGGMSNQLYVKVKQMIQVVKETFPRLECLGKTASGHPKHPSRLGYAAPIETWP